MDIKAKVVRVYETGKVRALLDITLDDQFAIHGVKLIAGPKGDFVAMPSESWKRQGQVQRADIVHPLSKETRAVLYRAVTDAYFAHIQAVPQASGPGQLPFDC